MSLPYFPPEVLEITCKQAFHMLLGSIAMEELALSHILNAEGEKLQYVVKKLAEQPGNCTGIKDILAVNHSVSELLDKVAHNQFLLKGKLQQVLDAQEHCCPAEDCPAHLSRTCQWRGEKNRRWAQGCPLPWRPAGKNDPCICWQGSAPGLIHLQPQGTYLVCFSFQIQAEEGQMVRVTLQKNHACGGEDIVTCEAAAVHGEVVHLSGCTPIQLGGKAAIQFVLGSPAAVLVKQAALYLIRME